MCVLEGSLQPNDVPAHSFNGEATILILVIRLESMVVLETLYLIFCGCQPPKLYHMWQDQIISPQPGALCRARRDLRDFSLPGHCQLQCLQLADVTTRHHRNTGCPSVGHVPVAPACGSVWSFAQQPSLFLFVVLNRSALTKRYFCTEAHRGLYAQMLFLALALTHRGFWADKFLPAGPKPSWCFRVFCFLNDVVFNMLRNRQLRYILHTCPNL